MEVVQSDYKNLNEMIKSLTDVNNVHVKFYKTKAVMGDRYDFIPTFFIVTAVVNKDGVRELFRYEEDCRSEKQNISLFDKENNVKNLLYTNDFNVICDSILTKEMFKE